MKRFLHLPINRRRLVHGRFLSSSPSSQQVVVNHYKQQKQDRPLQEGVLSSSRLPKDGLTLKDFVTNNNIGTDESKSTNRRNNGNANIGRSFHIKTYGCQMNVNDSDIVRAVLFQQGYTEAESEETADIWLTNTCAIRDKAEQKVWQRLNALKKKKKKRQIVGLLGCMAERLQEQILDTQMADLVVGPDAYRDLPNLIDDLWIEDNEDSIMAQAMNVQLNLQETYQDILPIRSAEDEQKNVSAFVSIQRGCSNRCSFCIVPFTRGQERSRPMESILQEIQQLLDGSPQLKEIVLLGQNVNSYHDRSESALLQNPSLQIPGVSNPGFRNRVKRPTSGGYHFVDLVKAVSDINPELRVRFTSPHPKDYPPELLQLMAETPNVCNQVHLPAQSGSTSMLKRMKRGYTREAYLELVEEIQSLPGYVAISSDFIAGFCQESEQEHLDTVSLLETVQYEQAFLFAYSLREKTHAHRALQDTVPPAVKQERLQQLIDTFRTKVHDKNERVEVGALRLVLVEGVAKRKAFTTIDDSANGIAIDTWHGRTDQNKRILFPHPKEDDINNSHLLHHNMISTLWNESLSSASSSGLNSEKDWKTAIATRSGSTSRSSSSSLSPGDYAVVEVTQAKGHTLRGRLLWKTTLSEFAKLEHNATASNNAFVFNDQGVLGGPHHQQQLWNSFKDHLSFMHAGNTKVL